MSESGSVVWPSAAEPIWRFDWRLADAPDEEGIAILGATYRGRQVFFKASLPSLRVQYDGRCGPFKDPLNYNNAQVTTRCPSRRVCVYSYVIGGVRALALESFHRIGAYRLIVRWIFFEDGQVYPRLYSAGLQCNYNHRHHVYWRFDFDIDGAANDLVLEYDTNTGWRSQVAETSRRKHPPTRRHWAIMDKSSSRGYYIVPGPNDGRADVFSYRDVWILRFQGAEDRNGRQGSAASDGLQPYLNGENTDGQDLVLWYVGHLAHVAAHGGDEWHSAGPNLAPFRW